MNKYGLKLANYLLDRYEGSVLSKQGSKLNLQIKATINTLFPKYNHSDYYQQHLLIDEACNELYLSKLVNLYYDQEDNILAVTLVLDKKAIGQLYLLTNRKDLSKDRNKLMRFLRTLNYNIDWLDDFIQSMLFKLKKYQSVSHYFNIENLDETKEIFQVLTQLELQVTEISFRRFSLKILKDTKKLELIKAKIVNIIKDYYPISFNDEEELFSYFNIIKNPGFIYLSGQIIIDINGQLIDVGKLNSPFSLTTENIDQLKIIDIQDHNVLTIENLTSFYDCNIDKTLVVYLGGYHNSLRRKILLKIYQFNPYLNYYHFGDIDAGGFYIYLHLVEKTKIPFKPVMMDIKTLIKYQNYTKKLTKNDRQRLLSLKDKLDLPVIDYMLTNNCKLEQEIIEINKL